MSLRAQPVRNAIAGRSFPSWEAFEGHFEAWTREVADVRVHGTTGEAPIERFRRASPGANHKCLLNSFLNVGNKLLVA
jgi:hypothetical protein